MNQIDIIIDELTPCLLHRESGEEYKTEYHPLVKADLKEVSNRAGWLFNWRDEFNSSDREVFKLQVIGSEQIQGLISLTQDQGFVLVHLVESAPANKGSDTKIFSGVGGHLFAIACKISIEAGFEGFVSFVSKSNLVSHYEQAIGALQIGNSLVMEIKPHRALRLVEHYFNKGSV